MKKYNTIIIVAIGALISFAPTQVSAVALGGACTGINNWTGVCKSASAGGSAGCNVADTIGAGTCDAGLICCSQGTPTAPTQTNQSGTQSGTNSAGNAGINTAPSGTTGNAGINAPPSSAINVTLINPLNAGTSLGSFLLNILQFVVYIGGIIVVLMIVFVGYKFVAARGAPEKLSEAKEMLLWTVVGALILLGAEAIAQGICATVQALSGGTGSCG